MKTEKEVREELKRVDELGHGDLEILAVRQVLIWMVVENTMAPYDYLMLYRN